MKNKEAIVRCCSELGIIKGILFCQKNILTLWNYSTSFLIKTKINMFRTIAHISKNVNNFLNGIFLFVARIRDLASL